MWVTKVPGRSRLLPIKKKAQPKGRQTEPPLFDWLAAKVNIADTDLRAT